ncbi:MAG: hypothetical protein ACRC35_14150, partial [Angustibacter sp.]
MGTPSRVDPPASRAEPGAEWWEAAAESLRRRAARSRFAPVLRRASAVVLWASLVYLVGLVLFWPSVSWGVRVWFAVVWVVLCWALLARTRTLRVATVIRIFGAAIPWSVAVGALSWWVTTSAAGLGSPQTDGGQIVVASIAEEILKLGPLAAMAAFAPGRVRRFAVADWALVGLASGAGFEVVEESVRRVYLMTTRGGLLDFCQYRSGLERLECHDVALFGIWPFGGSAAGDPPYAGHAIMTALVAVGVGVAVRVVRGGLIPRVAAPVAAALPVLLLVVAM